MAQKWSMEAAQALLRQWNNRAVEASVRAGGLTVDLNAVEAWLLDQRPDSLAEAERLLDLIVSHEAGGGRGLEQLCRVGGAVRNDVTPHRSRVEHSFAPRASGPLAGRA
ncbi:MULTISPECIES: hypothetical protein [unclassified Brevundimonas]|uniref:hypothetical protein n=1 Tax=unclassified Brevundimonas TaxID=2622653 RepID=UPI0025BD210B|nr:MULTISPECIES: hypothetical protein [unclassified Brevundimonas]